MTNITSVYFVAMFFGFATIAFGFVCLLFKREILNGIKLRKLIKLGYIIARLKRIDKTEKEIITIPNKETDGVTFPGIEGTYILDNASVILKDRKYPVYEWREGETTPINYETEYVTSNATCPECSKETTFKVLKPKSMNPAVLDNLILKIKTLAQMLTMKDLLTYLIIGGGIIVLVSGLGTFFVYDLKKRLPEILTPIIEAAIKKTIGNATLTL